MKTITGLVNSIAPRCINDNDGIYANGIEPHSDGFCDQSPSILFSVYIVKQFNCTTGDVSCIPD